MSENFFSQSCEMGNLRILFIYKIVYFDSLKDTRKNAQVNSRTIYFFCSRYQLNNLKWVQKLLRTFLKFSNIYA